MAIRVYLGADARTKEIMRKTLYSSFRARRRMSQGNLSPLESRVLRYRAESLPTRQIADLVGIPVDEVYNHLKRLITLPKELQRPRNVYWVLWEYGGEQGKCKFSQRMAALRHVAFLKKDGYLAWIKRRFKERRVQQPKSLVWRN